MNNAILILSNLPNMGKSQSKAHDNSGTVVNDIQIQPATIENTDLLVCVHIITVILSLQFIYKIYKLFHRNIKKKYATSV